MTPQTEHPSLIRPQALQPGDLITIVAPASNLKTEYLERGAAELKHLGYRVRYDADILSKGRYTAGSDQRRAGELTRAFADPETKAIWAARGGYGSMRILEHLDNRTLAENPKIFIGYSDMTALHLFLYQQFGLVTFHGPMAAKDLAEGPEHYDPATLLAALTRAEPMGLIRAPGTEMLHKGNGNPVSGRLLGGCLSLIVALMGTPWDLDTRGAILFIEDTGVKPFALDRMLQHLRLAGKFREIKGIVFGEMMDCVQHVNQGYTIQEALAECTGDLGVPVMFGLCSGHSPIGNLTLPLGVRATLDPEQGALIIDEAAVA